MQESMNSIYASPYSAMRKKLQDNGYVIDDKLKSRYEMTTDEMTVEKYFNSNPKGIEDFQKRLLFVLQNKEKIYEYLGKIIDEKRGKKNEY